MTDLLLVAVTTSLVTLSLGALVLWLTVPRLLARRQEELERRLQERARQGVEQAGLELLPKLEAGVRNGVEQAVAQALPRVRDQVRQGVREAGEELLPRLRLEVGEGAREGLTRAVKDDLIGKTGEQLARTGTSVLEAGLSLLLGKDQEDDGSDP